MALPGAYWGLSLVHLCLKGTGRDLHVVGRSPKEVCVFARKRGRLPSAKSLSRDSGGEFSGSRTPVGRSCFSADPLSGACCRCTVSCTCPSLLCELQAGCSAGRPGRPGFLAGSQLHPPGCSLPPTPRIRACNFELENLRYKHACCFAAGEDQKESDPPPPLPHPWGTELWASPGVSGLPSIPL